MGNKINEKSNQQKDLVSVIFPTMNRKEDLVKCINSIKESTHKNIEIIIVDNCSIDGTRELIKKRYPEVILIESKLNLGVPISFNQCISKSKGEFILRLDDDIILEKNVIEEMVKVLKNDSKIGGVSCLYFYTEQPNICRTSGMSFNLFTGKTRFYDQDKEYDGKFEGQIIEREIIGGVLLMKREVYDEIGGFTEEYFLSYEDVDLCFRIRKAGYKLVITSSARLYHKKGGGLSEKESPLRVYLNNRSRVLLMKRNAGWRNLFFFPYLLIILCPVKFLRFLFKGNISAIKSLTKGIFDGIFNEKVFVYTKEGKQIPYHGEIENE